MEDAQAKKEEFVRALAERATELPNTTAGCYLACISGMWADTLMVEKDPYGKNGGILSDWYRSGIAASRQARGQTLREKQAKEKKNKGMFGSA